MFTKNNILFASIVIICLAVLSRFSIEPFYFPVNLDDCLYAALLQKYSIWDVMQMLTGKYNGAYIAHFDGRMFSNFYSLLVFSILGTKHSVFYLYNLFMFLVLTGSFFLLVSALGKKGFISQLTFFKKILLSFFLSSSLFLFLIDGRYEVFYWVSGISNHLLSLIFFLCMLTLFVQDRGIINTSLLAILSFCLGQMNEVYAVIFIAIFFFLAFSKKQKWFSYAVMLSMTLLSLYLNLSAHGTVIRFHTLYSIDTHFNAGGAFIDMIDTFKLPFINYRYLPIKIALIVILFLSVKHYFQLKINMNEKYFLWSNRLALFAAVASIYLHCFVLGEICTYRGLLFYTLVLIYFIFAMGCRNISNPLKLFIS